MASRTAKGTKGFDNDIYKCRDESNWKKLQEMAEQLRQRGGGPHSQNLANLLIGESKLEMYLEDNPPVELNIAKARSSLADAKKYLTECTKTEGEKHAVATDAHFLLAKMAYSQGHYEQALEHLEQGGIDRLEEKSLGPRMLKVLAESFAIKGLCLEQAKNATIGKKDVIVKYYIQAGEMGLKYLQVVEKNQGIQGAVVQIGAVPGLGGLAHTEFRIGIILETALQRAPILMMKAGKIREAVEQYRGVLRAQETSSTQSLRMTLSRQLAEVLLRGVCEHEWQQIQPQQEQKKIGAKYWKPNNYSGGSLYLPGEHIEEILLLLAISDAIAVRNVVLDRSPDVAQDRGQSIKNVTAVLDLLSIALARNAQFSLLCEHFEKVAKFSSEEYHIWHQFGLCLISSGALDRGVRMLKESAKLRPKNGFDLLLAAKVTLNDLSKPKEALEMVNEAISREELLSDSDILSQCYTLKGLAHEVLADTCGSPNHKMEHRMEAFKAFVKAKNADPDFHQAEYLLGLHYANVHQIDAAMVCAKRVLHLAPDFFPGVQLLIVLLTAQKKHEEALQLVEITLEEYPNNLNLLYLKVYLEDYIYGALRALHTAGEMLKQWKVLYENFLRVRHQTKINSMGNHPNLPINTTTLGIVPATNAHSGRASGLGSNWVTERDSCLSAATKVEKALNETLQAVSPSHRKCVLDEDTILQMQMHIWLLTAELYIKLDHFPEAELSLAEAGNITPLSQHLFVVRGMLHEQRKEYGDAKVYFDSALAINPQNVKALQHLSMVLLSLGSSRLAESTLRKAALLDPMSHHTWFYLGKVLQESGTSSDASECLETAMQLEVFTPILEFSKLPRNF